MAICTGCGAQNSDADIYCTTCGKSVSESAPPAPPSFNNAGPATSNQNLAMWAHLGALLVGVSGLFTGFTGLLAWLPPLIIMNKSDADAFTKEHAKESLNFQLFWLIFAFISIIVIFFGALVTLGLGLIVFIPLVLAVGIFQLVVMIQASVAASSGKTFKYPFVLIKFYK